MKSFKKFLCIFMSIPVLAGAGFVSHAQSAGGAVITAAEASDTDLYAAKLLSRYLNEIDGREYPVKTEGENFEGVAFYVGATSKADAAALEGKSDGSYFIEPVEGGAAIYGAGRRGTIYGIFGYLQDCCACRWFTAEDGMQCTAGREVVLPAQKIEYNAYFEYTDTDWHSPTDPVYSIANGLNGSPYRRLSDEQGGNTEYLGGFCHTFINQFCKPDKYFDSHPEYYALRDGRRVTDQLCLTNEGVYETVLSEVLDLLRTAHNPEAEVQIVSLTQNDNQKYCQCDKCRALDEENGSQSGTMITFVNRIARAVKAAGYDNVALDTFAYQYTRKAPTKVVPDDNVIVRLCTIECCFTHPLNDSSCERNAALMKDLEDWNKICSRIYVWDYTTNYAYTVGIMPDFGVLQENMQCFYEHGVKGVYEEGAYYVNNCNAEFGELRAYLISRLLRDPYCDFDRETELFCNSFYGEGGPYIREFIGKITENAQKRDSGIYARMTDVFDFSQAEAVQLDELWAKAKEAAKDEKALAAIERSELSWRYVKASLGLGEFKGAVAGSKAKEELYNDLVKHGIVTLGEGRSELRVIRNYKYLPPEDWENNSAGIKIKAFFYAFVDLLFGRLTGR
ncbi:MAG: DUF4838 domain-containing protein [Clostridia bacterium]|nr:DUF4838 domain-containing protein [Clostridia bacterium]